MNIKVNIERDSNMNECLSMALNALAEINSVSGEKVVLDLSGVKCVLPSFVMPLLVAVNTIQK